MQYCTGYAMHNGPSNFLEKPLQQAFYERNAFSLPQKKIANRQFMH